MKPLVHPHFLSDLNNFGLKSRFFVYARPKLGREESPLSAQDRFAEAPRAPSLSTRELQEQNQKWEKEKKNLEQNLEPLRKEAEALAADYNELCRVKRRPDEALSLAYGSEGKLDGARSLQRARQLQTDRLNRRQRRKLEALEAVLSRWQQLQLTLLKHSAEKAYASVEQSDVDSLQDFSQAFLQQEALQEKQNHLTKKPYYDKIKSDFNLAAKNWATRGDSKKFDHFWSNPSGYSSAKEAESEKWFLALAATKTNGFENDFLLSELDQFTQDPQINRQRFPYLYEQWLQMKGIDDKRLQQAEQALAKQKNLMQRLPVPSLKTLIQDLGDAPAFKNIGKIPKLPEAGKESEEAWKALKDYTDRAIGALDREIFDRPRPENEEAREERRKEIEKLKRSKIHLEHYHKLALLQLQRLVFAKDQEGQLEQFTKSNLDPAQNRQLRVELAMRQFAAAKSLVESPFNETQWNHLHPMTNGLLTAMIYENGVQRETPEKTEGGEKEYAWLIAQVTQSPALNASQRGKNLSPEAKDALIYAQLGNEVLQRIKENPDLNTPQARQFIGQVEAAIAAPGTAQAKALKLQLEQGAWDALVGTGAFQKIQKFQRNVELNYKALDLSDSRKERLGQLGIDLQGFHESYLQELKKDPRLNVENWNTLLFSGTPGEFHKIQHFFALTLPQSMAGGKEKFLSGLKVLNRRYQENALKDLKDEEALAIQIVQELGAHLRKAEGVAAYSDRQDTEIEATLNGELMVDKLGYAVETVIDGLRNPRDYTTFASSALVVGAGGYFIYRLLTERGEDLPTWVKASRWGAALLAANVVAERTTGRGISDLTGLNTIAKKMEGTQEAVLLEKGQPEMEAKNITQEQYAHALYELNDLPFHQVMEWYNSSDENGMPQKGQRDLLPKGVDLGQIYKGEFLKKTDPTLEARRILKASAEQFFAYVSHKNLGRQGNVKHGADMLEERWVTLVKHPNANAVRSTVVSQYMTEYYHARPKELTWKKVMEMEVDLFDVEATLGKNGITPALDILEQTGRGFAEWGRAKEGQIEGYVENFMPKLAYQKEKLVDFLAEVGETGGKKLEFAANEVKFWVEGNQYRIRQFGRKHLELVLESGEIVLGGAAQLYEGGVDWSLETLRGFNKIVNQGEISRLQGDRLTLEDIAQSEAGLNSYNKQENPELEYFGRYQKSFYQALKNKTATQPAYFETPQGNQEYPDEGVGYFIAEVRAEELELSPNPSSNEINSKLQITSRERARRFFLERYQTLSGDEVDRYLYPVHVKRGIAPEQMVTFWRMPLPRSWELWAKNNDKWAGSWDPKQHLHTPPFELDPSLDVIDQLTQLYGVQVGKPVDVAVNFTTNIGSRPFTFALQNIEWAGELGADLVDFMKEDTQMANLLRDLTQRSPEFKTNVAEFTTNLNYSPYYRDSAENRGIYELCLEHAQSQGHRLNLSLLKEDSNYPGSRYLQKPSPYRSMEEYYTSLNQFYQEVEKASKGENKKFEDLIARGLQKEQAKRPAGAATQSQP